ncbi:hypothetical protein F8154_05785 [Alkaliphilus pronyensis]|uniref:ATP-binding protein n=1 Tax=Alkaliphilus pronyensis TaxID=1482732 RepID=A0A6I0FHK3_9FIRM|nr:ATP-binding protein [Alkaliphilus pronyensis]KAB3535641.1 hypothetical protein F8154_05785 [Alkaliphilus pronyensis]
MYEFPIKYFADNLIFNHRKNECWAYFKLEGMNYDFLKEESKIQALNTLAIFLANIGQEAKIHIIPIAQDIDAHFDGIINELDKTDPLYNKTLAHATGTRDHIKAKIKRKGMSNDYNIYVGTKLNIKEYTLQNIKDAFIYLIQHPLNILEEIIGAKTKSILDKEIQLFQDLSAEYFKRQNKRIKLTKISETTTQWLNRRMFRRGLGEVKLKDNWYKSLQGKLWLKRNRDKRKKNIEAIEKTMNRHWSPYTERTIKNGEYGRLIDTDQALTLSEGVIDVSEGRTLKVHHEEGISNQAFLSISHIPDGILFPGSEWLLVLQDFTIQTEVCIHIETNEHKESIRSVGKQKRDIQGQIEHVSNSEEEVPDDILEAKENANLLEAELKATRAPITRASITICIAADTKETLEDRVAFVKEFYEDQNFLIERSYSDQLKLFMEFIPGTGRYVTDYIQPLPPRTLAGSMFAATRQLGDNIGPYIGTTGAVEKSVYLDMGRACLLNRSASAFFFGTLGGGKSFNANLMAYLNVIYGCGKALIFDPKAERAKWLHLLPELKDYINVITLSPSIEDKGKLDPYIVYKGDVEAASELATNILSEVFKLNPNDDEYTAVLEAVNQLKKLEGRCMIKLAEILGGFPESDELAAPARKLARRIRLLRENGMAGLLFGDGTEEALSFKNKINILQIQNLALPKADTKKEDFTQEEVISTVLMLPIASFAKKYAMSGEPCFKLVLFDESWGLKATTMGLKLMDFLARMGRSLYGGCIFIGHSVDDLGEGGIKNAISYKFCFRMAEREETIKALKFMKLEVTDENIQEIETLQDGECLFQDLDGRIGRLKFDVVFEHLLEAFKTTPKKKKAGGENGVSA